MATTIQCQACGQRYQAQDSLAGKQIKCKKCGAVIAVPALVHTHVPAESDFRVVDLLDDIRPARAQARESAPGASSNEAANPYAAPRSALADTRPRYRRYEDVPWYRRSFVNTLFVLSGFVGLPLIVWCCINLVTGDVYYNDVDETGRLKKWSKANKVVAGILLLIYAVAFVAMFFNKSLR
jgi:hypothetical protein